MRSRLIVAVAGLLAIAGVGPSSRSVQAISCSIASAFSVFQNFSVPFTRAWNSLICDSIRLLVQGNPSRRYLG